MELFELDVDFLIVYVVEVRYFILYELDREEVERVIELVEIVFSFVKLKIILFWILIVL